MRLKQQTFVDKYIEKVILGVAALIGIAIVFMFVIGTPYAIDLKGQKAAPDEVEKSYRAQAEQLKRAVDRSEPPAELANLVIPDYVNRFDARYYQRLVSSDTFYGIVFGPPGVPGTGGPERGPVRFVEIVPPVAASELAASTTPHVLDTDEALVAYYTDMALAQYPDAKADEIKRIATDWARKAVALAGGKNPRDFHSASVSGTISPQLWLERLEKVDPDKKMAESWYIDILQFIAAIEVRRQVQNADGSWPANDKYDVLPPLPGAVSVILDDYVKQVQDAKTGAKKVDEEETTMLQQLLVENLRFYIEDLTKPQFLPVKAHRPWQQPDVAIPQLSPEDQQAVFKLNQQIARIEADLRQLMGRAGVGATDPADPTGVRQPPRIINPSDPYGLEDPRGTGKGKLPNPKQPPVRTPPVVTPKGKQPSPTDPLAPKKNPNEERIALNQTKLADLYKQRDEILVKLYKDETDPTKVDPTKPLPPGGNLPDPRRPGVRPPEGPFPGGRDPRIFNPGGRRPGILPPRGVLDPAEETKLEPIKFWAHDVSVQAGKTYRYQIAYKVINPLFNKEAELIDAQKAKASELLQVSEASAWTAPVTIEPDVQYFVEDTNTSTSAVTWGVYRLHNGYRIHKQFVTRPGDPIGKAVEIDVMDEQGAKAGKDTVDMRIPAILVDLKSPPRTPGAINVRGPITVLLADLLQGTMTTRDPVADRDNADRIRLANEVAAAIAPAPVAPGTPGAVDPRIPVPGRGNNPLLPPEVRPPPR